MADQPTEGAMMVVDALTPDQRLHDAFMLLTILRGYPDFDEGGPLPEAIDEWLAGKRPQILVAYDQLKGRA